MEKIPRFDWTLLLLQKGKAAAQDHRDGRSHTGNQRESENNSNKEGGVNKKMSFFDDYIDFRVC